MAKALFKSSIRYAHTFHLLYETYTLLAAGFCERWPKACALGLRWLRPAAFDYGKKLAANGSQVYLVADLNAKTFKIVII